MASPSPKLRNQGPLTWSVAWRRHIQRPRAPTRFAFEHHTQGSSHSTGRYQRHQNLIWFHNVSLYWNAGWKKGTTLFRQRMPFNFHDFLWIFQNLESITMTFPCLEKNGIPWLFQVFHHWIHPVNENGLLFNKVYQNRNSKLERYDTTYSTDLGPSVGSPQDTPHLVPDFLDPSHQRLSDWWQIGSLLQLLVI